MVEPDEVSTTEEGAAQAGFAQGIEPDVGLSMRDVGFGASPDVPATSLNERMGGDRVADVARKQ
jgi:hypothetical protein